MEENKIFLINLNIFIDLDNNKLLSDYKFNNSIIEDSKKMSDISIDFLKLLENKLLYD